MEHFCKNSNSLSAFNHLLFLYKSPLIDVWQGFQYNSGDCTGEDYEEATQTEKRMERSPEWIHEIWKSMVTRHMREGWVTI